MAMSGIPLCDTVEEYAKAIKNNQAVMMKFDSKTNPSRVILDDDPLVTVEDGSSLVAKLRERWSNEEVGWALARMTFSTDESSDNNDMILVCWTPDQAKVKQKMVASSSKCGIHQRLDGWVKGLGKVQINGVEDLTPAYIFSYCDKFVKKHVVMADSCKLKGKPGKYQEIEK